MEKRKLASRGFPKPPPRKLPKLEPVFTCQECGEGAYGEVFDTLEVYVEKRHPHLEDALMGPPAEGGKRGEAIAIVAEKICGSCAGKALADLIPPGCIPVEAGESSDWRRDLGVD